MPISDWPVPYPACPSPIVNSIAGCDFVTIAPPHVRQAVDDILQKFKRDKSFKGQQAVTHGLWGISSAEQTRLRIRLTVLWYTLERIRPTRSAIVELGTYLGTTAMGMRMVMDLLGYRYPEHVLHVYDSFRGLPPPSRRNDGRTELQAGHLRSNIDAYLERFRAAGLDPPYLHKGFFGEIPTSEYPDAIAFAFYDGDFYESIRDSFNRTWHKMLPGGSVVIDDYFYGTLEGVKRCVDDMAVRGPGRVRARLYDPPLNVSHKHRYESSHIAFASYEGVITVEGS